LPDATISLSLNIQQNQQLRYGTSLAFKIADFWKMKLKNRIREKRFNALQAARKFFIVIFLIGFYCLDNYDIF
jgi:hypothetical protein